MRRKKNKKIEELSNLEKLKFGLYQQKLKTKELVLNYIDPHLNFLWFSRTKSTLNYGILEKLMGFFSTVNFYFWKFLNFLPFSIFSIFLEDIFQMVSFFVFLRLRKTLMFGAFKGLDFKQYSFLNKNKTLNGVFFYFRSLMWPRQKWYFLLRKLTWKERAFKFFLSGPFGWLGFFYYFFFVRALTVSAYWLLKILVGFYMFMPKKSREESILWNINRLGLLERRFEDKSLFPGFSIDMSMYFYLYLRLAVSFGIEVM